MINFIYAIIEFIIVIRTINSSQFFSAVECHDSHLLYLLQEQFGIAVPKLNITILLIFDTTEYNNTGN